LFIESIPSSLRRCARPPGTIHEELCKMAMEDFVLLSGTKVREMLGQGIAPRPRSSPVRRSPRF
jgi:ATP sulfurylase